jgi:hypothetical protein
MNFLAHFSIEGSYGIVLPQFKCEAPDNSHKSIGFVPTALFWWRPIGIRFFS